MTEFRLRVLVFCVFASLVVISAGCGSSSSDDDARVTGGGPAMLNTGKIESAIEKSITNQRGVQAQVSCPKDVQQQKDIVFSCDAVVDSNTTKFTVTELDDAGHVHYEAL